ncbi:MAG: polysaccharide biosynthesis protein [Lachnospiraceae bacterium]|nr:polysaccharide biosynthesis protein [Lachnospiraceae bacterium]
MSKKKQTKNIAGSILLQGGILAIAGIVARAIGLIRRIPLTNIIGDMGNGYYANAYEIYSIVLLLSSYSLPVAISRLVASRTERGQIKNTQKYFKGALLFALISGGLSCSLVMVFADTLATVVMGEPKSAMALRVLAPTLLIFAVMGAFRGYFQGKGTMVVTAISQIIEQIILVATSLVFASIFFNIGAKFGNVMMDENFAPALGAAGATVGCGLGALASLLYVMINYQLYVKKRVSKEIALDPTKKTESMTVVMTTILITVVPFILSTVIYNVSGILNQSTYNHYMDALGEVDLKTLCMGVYSGKYKVLINLPVALANAMVSAIVPSLSASVSKNDHVTARMKVASAIRVTMIITIPCAVGLAVLGHPIVDLLFNGEIDMAARMLYIGTLSIIFFALSTLGNGILQGIGKIYVPVINAAIALAVNVLSMQLFLRGFKIGIYSVVLANMLFSLVMCVLNHFMIHKFLHYKQELKRTFIIPMFCSLIMGAITFLIYVLFHLFLPFQVACIIAIGFAVVIYLVLMTVFKGFTKETFEALPMGDKLLRFFRRFGLFKR